MIADSAAKDAETVKQYVAAYEEAGCDELIFFPSSSDPAAGRPARRRRAALAKRRQSSRPTWRRIETESE